MFYERIFAAPGGMLRPLCAAQRAPALRELRQRGCAVYILDAAAIAGEDSFFLLLMKEFLPDQEPPPFPNWQGMYDYIYNAIRECDRNEIAVCLENSDHLYFRDVSLLMAVLESFIVVDQIISTSQGYPDRPRPFVRVLLFGTGSNYPVC